MHEPYRTPQRHAAGVHEAPKPADALLQQEAAQPTSSVRSVLGLLQLLLAHAEAGQERTEAANRRYDEQAGRPYLDVRRTFCGGAGK